MSRRARALERWNGEAWLLAVSILAAAGVGCGGSGMGADMSPPVELPESYSEPPETPTGYSIEVGGGERVGWCADFGDSDLLAMEERVLRDNLDLQAAWARLEQADAVARQTGSLRYPTVDAQLAASRSRSYIAPQLEPEARNMFQASLPAAYEIDLWGRIRETYAASEADVLALRGDIEAIATTLTARVAETWFDVLHQRALADLVEAQLETSRRYLETIYARMGLGQAAAPDILLQQRQIEALEAALVLIGAREQVALQQLAVLLGRTPQSFETADRRSLPNLPPRPEVGVPADLLINRPDVWAAQYRLAAADHRVAAAIADRLPALRLSGSLSLQATSLSDFVNDFFFGIAGSIVGPLFDGGRRAAEVDRTEAVFVERLSQYGQALLVAIQEVESALVLEREQLAYIEQLMQQLDVAQTALQIEGDRYRWGASDYLRVLVALQSLQEIEQRLVDAQRQLLSYRVQLCRAIGGEWTNDLAPPFEIGEES